MADETTFFLEPKDDPRDRISVEVGDSKQPDFHPQTKIMRWDNEVNVSLRLVHDEESPTVQGNGEKVEWIGETKQVDFYEIEDATEIDVTLFERPAGDKLEFSINTKGVEFYYQPPLTDKEIKAGFNRPDNIVGSWVVWATEQRTNIDGKTIYGTGKVGHIFNSLMSDAKGRTARTNPQIVDNGDGTGKLTINFDKDFLENAVYPIRHAAGLTFGYTTAGGSSATSSLNQAVATIGTPSGAGTVSSISAYVKWKETGAGNIKPCLWQVSDGVIPTNGIAPSLSVVNTTPDWLTSNYSSSPSVTAQSYYVGYIGDSSHVNLYYDNLGGTVGNADIGNNYAVPETFVPYNSGIEAFAWSIYATYSLDVNNYTLTCSQGSYSVTGQSMTPKAGRKLTAAQGSYAVTGQTLNLKRGLKVAMAQGSYSLNGQMVVLTHGYKSILAQGSYALTGQNAALKHGFKLTLAQGSYSLTGQNIALNHGYKTVADQGPYSLTGQDLNFKRGLKMPLTQGSYSLTGVAVEIVFGNRLAADPGYYSLNGQSVNLKRGVKAPLAQGSYSVTGQNVGTVHGYITALAQGSYAVTGQSLNPKRSLLVSLLQGSYMLTGQDLTPKRGVRLAMAQGSYVLSGQNLLINGITRRLYANQGSYSVTGQAAGVNRGVRVGLVTGNYALTGQDARLLANRRLYANQGSYALTGNDLAFRRTLRTTLAQGSYTVTGFPVGLTYAAVYAYPLHLSINTGHQYLDLGEA